LPALEFSLSGSQVAQPFLPLGFQPTRHHPVFRLNSAVLALGAISLVARPLNSQSPLSKRSVMIGFQLPYRLFGNCHGSRRHRLQKCVGDGLIDLNAADGEAIDASPLNDVLPEQ
jgi:hypothetical protein